MTRPKIPRRIHCRACCPCFKPEGLEKDGLDELKILPEELEVLKLHDVDDLEQKQAAKKMNISQSTFARILQSARKKVALALVEGRIIRLVIDG